MTARPHRRRRLGKADLERAHYRLQRRLYFTEAVDIAAGTGARATVFLADGMEDPEWNHAALLAAPADGLSDLLDHLEEFFASRGRPAAVELGPSCGVIGEAWRSKLARRGYEAAYCYAWLVPESNAGPDRNGDPAEIHPAEITRVESQADTDAYFGVFRAVYGDELDPGYERALRRPGPKDKESDEDSEHRVEVEHLLLRIGDAPAAVATALHDLRSRVSGLYNLAVHPAWRRRGLGRRLTDERLRSARRRGHLAFLQTERRSVEDWQRRHGFELAFVTEGWVRRASAPIS